MRVNRTHRPQSAEVTWVWRCSTLLLGEVRIGVVHGIRNFFQRRSSSSGGTSSTWVAIHQMLPKGSFTPPYRSPLGSVMMGKTEMPPELRARRYTLSESAT